MWWNLRHYNKYVKPKIALDSLNFNKNKDTSKPISNNGVKSTGILNRWVKKIYKLFIFLFKLLLIGFFFILLDFLLYLMLDFDMLSVLMKYIKLYGGFLVGADQEWHIARQINVVNNSVSKEVGSNVSTELSVKQVESIQFTINGKGYEVSTTIIFIGIVVVILACDALRNL